MKEIGTLSSLAGEQALLVICNAPDSKTAATIAENVVAARLAACANILPACRSVYRWQGRTESEEETPLLIKTTAARLAALTDAIATIHPYETPEIIAVPIVGGLPAYLQWLAEECAAF